MISRKAHQAEKRFQLQETILDHHSKTILAEGDQVKLFCDIQIKHSQPY